MRYLSSALACGMPALCCAAASHAEIAAVSGNAQGTASLTVEGVSLLAVYRMTPMGLRATLSILDANSPRSGTIREVILLQEGQQRTIELPNGGTAVRVTIARIGDGIRVTAGSASRVDGRHA